MSVIIVVIAVLILNNYVKFDESVIMKVLIACEFSGTVREAFRKRGHDAWSCDLLPTEVPGQHIQGDVLPLLEKRWDLIIAHPPCTHLSASGAAWWAEKQRDGRQQQGVDFFMEFANAKCAMLAIENPIGIMSRVYRKPDQIIQPFMFGHPARKSTCLWLRGLPCLTPTDIVNLPSGKARKQNPLDWLSPSKDRWKLRSKTYTGIADAMAQQWGVVAVA